MKTLEQWMEEIGILAHGTPAKPQHGREPDEVKPLAQYLGEYLNYELVEVNADNIEWRELLEQALDAYQSTENVTIKIERNVR